MKTLGGVLKFTCKYHQAGSVLLMFHVGCMSMKM
jgi:hypothetical protein